MIGRESRVAQQKWPALGKPSVSRGDREAGKDDLES